MRPAVLVDVAIARGTQIGTRTPGAPSPSPYQQGEEAKRGGAASRQAREIGTEPTPVAVPDAQWRTGGPEPPPTTLASQQQQQRQRPAGQHSTSVVIMVMVRPRQASSNIQRDATPKSGGQKYPVAARLPRIATARQKLATEVPRHLAHRRSAPDPVHRCLWAKTLSSRNTIAKKLP